MFVTVISHLAQSGYQLSLQCGAQQCRHGLHRSIITKFILLGRWVIVGDRKCKFWIILSAHIGWLYATFEYSAYVVIDVGTKFSTYEYWNQPRRFSGRKNSPPLKSCAKSWTNFQLLFILRKSKRGKLRSCINSRYTVPRFRVGCTFRKGLNVKSFNSFERYTLVRKLLHRNFKTLIIIVGSVSMWIGKLQRVTGDVYFKNRVLSECETACYERVIDKHQLRALQGTARFRFPLQSLFQTYRVCRN